MAVAVKVVVATAAEVVRAVAGATGAGEVIG
jgi:hypothetical protein